MKSLYTLVVHMTNRFLWTTSDGVTDGQVVRAGVSVT